MVTSALAAPHRSLRLDAVADGRVLAPPPPTHVSIPAPLVSPLMAVAALSPPMAGAGRVKSVIALVPRGDGKPLPPPPLTQSADQMFIRAPPRRVSSTPAGTPASSRAASPVLTPRPTARALTVPMRSASPDSARSRSPSPVFMRRHRTASHVSAATSSVAPATGSPSSSSGSGGGNTSLSKEVKSAVGKFKSMFRKDKSGSKSPTSSAVSPALTPQLAPAPNSNASGSSPSVRGSPSVRSVRGSPGGRSSTTSPTVKGSPTLSTISTLALDPAMEARYPALAELASEYMAGGGAATDKDDRGTARRRGTLRAMPRASAMSADSDDDMAAGGRDRAGTQ
ncbi:hypothetical protein AMAG_12319 [Allomyces macrogynus ATCC 38327]|uniref:Uncharacterized protein n=1 Tax=Allomyces macrogynus (strain ATCC 38327) TaxID=578462 RepID=A0A0L0SXX7_ALLM3|nr:hypothetical protein AMAG_12319 [Allomyces macrogynus ATCC 38327]|eukprot:KNE67250.1 hypothetical protein AMAG_12319 [Allomyces macrogynus ATCC 38327]